MSDAPPPVVALTISSFRSDEAAIALLDAAAAHVPALFARAIVVDSMGSGRIAAYVATRGWDWVRLHDAATNLGSAGNLALRLQMAAEDPACDLALAVNHDGEINAAGVAAMVALARSEARVGAVYPLRRLINQDDRYDLSGFSRLPMRRRVSDDRPTAPAEIHWSSSNGALYALAPVRAGLLPRAELWMGYEDLGYGWALERAGWRQLLCPAAEYGDSYEFTRFGNARRAKVSQKPAWYAYYNTRNLILLGRWNVGGLATWPLIARRVAVETALTLTVRPQKAKRLRLLARGIVDGLRGATGMRVKP